MRVRMSLFSTIITRMTRGASKADASVEPAAAYDLWAESYDEQPGNLMLHLEDTVFNRLLAKVNLGQKTVVDIGCGTGRHWNQILQREPEELLGCDVSAEMLKRLHQKYPAARTYLTQGHALVE